jgi:hypothetical protein
MIACGYIIPQLVLGFRKAVQSQQLEHKVHRVLLVLKVLKVPQVLRLASQNHF